MGYNMMNGYGYMSGWGMGLGGLMMIAWIALLVALVVFLVRAFSGSSRRVSRHSAVDILEQRYARGEIDTSDYEERMQILRSAI